MAGNHLGTGIETHGQQDPYPTSALPARFPHRHTRTHIHTRMCKKILNGGRRPTHTGVERGLSRLLPARVLRVQASRHQPTNPSPNAHPHRLQHHSTPLLRLIHVTPPVDRHTRTRLRRLLYALAQLVRCSHHLAPPLPPIQHPPPPPRVSPRTLIQTPRLPIRPLVRVHGVPPPQAPRARTFRGPPRC